MLRRDDLRTPGGHRLGVAVLPGGIVRYGIEDVGLYIVTVRERAIDFFPSPEADPMRVEHFLVNAVLPIYVGLHADVCLHASGVARGGRATIFAGPSGSGKSTKALEAIGRDGILLGDDAVVVRMRGDEWLVYPGARTMRLDERPPEPSWRSGPKHEWFVPSSRDPVPLGDVVVLQRPGLVPDAPPRGSDPLRALLSLQPGWVWGDIRTRRVVADRTAALCYPVSNSPASAFSPLPLPVRSQTLPSGSSLGGSYESGQGSSTGRSP